MPLILADEQIIKKKNCYGVTLQYTAMEYTMQYISMKATLKQRTRNSFTSTSVDCHNCFVLFFSSSPTAGYDICWHTRGCGEGSNSQLLLLLDLPSVYSSP